ncbi:MAG: ABC transporter substrate-binding protein [Anaerolineae bacterium]
MRPKLLWPALLAALLLFSGCSSRALNAPILIGVRSANDHAPFFLADLQGLYAAHGLDVTVQVLPSNTEIIEALRRGDMQIGVVPATTAIAAIAQGSPLRIVAMTGRGSDGLLVRAEEDITSLADLRGKRIATIRASILDVLLRHALEGAGLDPERDVELVYMATLGDMVAALKTGQVAASSNTEPFLTDAERRGWGRVLSYYTEDWPDHPCCVVVVHERFARRDPAALDEVLDVHCQTVAWANAHRAETAQVIADTLGGLDPELVAESLAPQRMRIDAAITLEEMRQMAELMVRYGLIERAPDDARLLDAGPLARVGSCHD